MLQSTQGDQTDPRHGHSEMLRRTGESSRPIPPPVTTYTTEAVDQRLRELRLARRPTHAPDDFTTRVMARIAAIEAAPLATWEAPAPFMAMAARKQPLQRPAEIVAGVMAISVVAAVCASFWLTVTDPYVAVLAMAALASLETLVRALAEPVTQVALSLVSSAWAITPWMAVLAGVLTYGVVRILRQGQMAIADPFGAEPVYGPMPHAQ